jgi:FAD/FMN-containing dehydrogenase
MGGYGWLTGAQGLTLDNILSVEIVLASGEIVRASKTENADLFWAVRGAGACFGVTTSFTFRAHPQENLVWNGNLVLPGTALRTALEAANKVLAKANDTGRASLGMLWVSPPGAPAPSIVLMLYYNGPEDEAKDFFKPLLHLTQKLTPRKYVPGSQSTFPSL